MASGKAAGATLMAGLVIVSVLALAAWRPGGAVAGAAPASVSLNGKALYRTYCGKCHALAAALSAGFGNSGGGLGADGGPSFDELRVPAPYTILAITEPTGGHERVRTRLNPSQVKAIAAWLARTTRNNPIPALPTDG